MGIFESSHSRNHFDTVSRKLSLGNIDLGFYDMLDPKGQIRHADLVFYSVTDAIDVLVVVAGKVQDRFAHGLARDRSGVDADATNHLAPFNQRDTLSAFGTLDGCSLT